MRVSALTTKLSGQVARNFGERKSLFHFLLSMDRRGSTLKLVGKVSIITSISDLGSMLLDVELKYFHIYFDW